ncbi:MAG: cytidylate kinase, partial [Promethearchaeota archaeon CR_4]
GKSTVAKIVATTLHLEYYSTGVLFRKLAKEYKMSLAQFSRYAEDHPDIDRQLDDAVIARAQQGQVVVEGQLVGFLVRDVPGCIRVLLTASDDVRLQRMCERDTEHRKEKDRETLTREKSEQERFLKFYKYDLRDFATQLDMYDLILNATKLSAEQVAGIIICAVRT